MNDLLTFTLGAARNGDLQIASNDPALTKGSTGMFANAVTAAKAIQSERTIG